MNNKENIRKGIEIKIINFSVNFPSKARTIKIDPKIPCPKIKEVKKFTLNFQRKEKIKKIYSKIFLNLKKNYF